MRASVYQGLKIINKESCVQTRLMWPSGWSNYLFCVKLILLGLMGPIQTAKEGAAETAPTLWNKREAVCENVCERIKVGRHVACPCPVERRTRSLWGRQIWNAIVKIWLGLGLEMVLWVTMTTLLKFRELGCHALKKKNWLSVRDGRRTDPFIHPDLLPMRTLPDISLRCGSARKNCSQKMFLSVL